MVSGKEFRQSLRKPLPNAPRQKKCRVVPAFTIQAMQRNTCVLPPPTCNPFLESPPGNVSVFRNAYLRGELPVTTDAQRTTCIWKTSLEKVDYMHILPILFDGLAEREEPYKLIATQAISAMLARGGHKVFPCIPQLIIPLKTAINTKNKEIMMTALRVLQKLVKSYPLVGEALVPYYRQLLPTLNLYKEINVNCGDCLDNSQVKGENLADLINETLELLEEYGGEDAFINIKYMIPTYESCVMN